MNLRLIFLYIYIGFSLYFFPLFFPFFLLFSLFFFFFSLSFSSSSPKMDKNSLKKSGLGQPHHVGINLWGPACFLFVSCTKTIISCKSGRIRRLATQSEKFFFETFAMIPNLPVFGFIKGENLEKSFPCEHQPFPCFCFLHFSTPKVHVCPPSNNSKLCKPCLDILNLLWFDVIALCHITQGYMQILSV